MKNKVFSFREKKAILFCTKVSFYLASTSWRSETKQNKHNFKKRNLYFFGSYVILFAFFIIITISCMHFTNTLQVKSICKRKILHLMLACVWNTKCPDVLDYTNVPFFFLGNILFVQAYWTVIQKRIRVDYVNRHCKIARI